MELQIEEIVANVKHLSKQTGEIGGVLQIELL